MKVTEEMISENMRREGNMFRMLFHPDNEKRFRRVQKLVTTFKKGSKPHNPQVVKEEVFIPRRDGKQIRVCIYKPKDLDPNQPVTGLLWNHGGGYAFGVPEVCTETYEKIITSSPTVIVAPDYRLSIEAPFPAAFEDSYDTLLWMKDNAERLGIRKDQLFVGGESAGGGLTCCVSAYARDKGDVNIAFQLPLYPMLDDRMTTDSMKDNDAPIWSEKSNRAAWQLYLGDAFGTDEVSPYAAPARLTDYTKLPPTYTFVGDIEPFYDEVVTYISHLKAAGVTAEVDIYKGAFHSFDSTVPKSPEAIDATQKMIEHYQYAVSHYFAPQA